MKTKIWSILILIIATLVGAYFYTYSQNMAGVKAEDTQSQIKESDRKSVV